MPRLRMDIFKALSPVIAAFLLIAAGFVFAHWNKISLAFVTEIIVHLGTPSIVFSSLASKPPFAGDLAILTSGITAIYAGVGLLIRDYFIAFRFHSRGFALPVLFIPVFTIPIAFWLILYR